MAGPGSAAVSRAGTPVAGPAGRDLFAEGLLEFLRPAVQQLDSHVHAVRESQVELREQIDNLATGTAQEAKPQCCQGNSPKEGNAGFRSLPPWLPKQVTGRKMVPWPQDSTSTVFQLPHCLQDILRHQDSAVICV
ncbi:SNARE-associated protein Snapin isoform X2 [Phyllostomus hastatus]|uniref:SNARE-associated protein Snapin isoform X2 n=1 Tax=Phyllostomus hastatus TaxID=9423 RepID=UPI001E6834EC|nr:SNARE-associated protein Snapin isoform X2 [Phyllostomus hastatus]